MTHRGRIVAGHVLILTAILSLEASVWRAAAQVSTASAPAVLRDLAGISDLQMLFDREADKIRIVLLLSPT